MSEQLSVLMHVRAREAVQSENYSVTTRDILRIHCAPHDRGGLSTAVYHFKPSIVPLRHKNAWPRTAAGTRKRTFSIRY